jgi:hypothetical protein
MPATADNDPTAGGCDTVRTAGAKSINGLSVGMVGAAGGFDIPEAMSMNGLTSVGVSSFCIMD